MKKVAILTNMMDFNSGYSLTGIIKDQTKMLTRYGHDVTLFVNQQFNQESLPDFSHVKVNQTIPFSHLTDYHSQKDISDYHKETVKNTTEVLIEQLKDIDIVYTHDFMFTGWFLPYALACIEVSKKLPHLRWMHWVHSVPSSMYDWWDINVFGSAHKIIFPNGADTIRVAEQYRGAIKDVRIIPHIKDIRTWMDFHKDTNHLIDLMPSVLNSRIMQIFPASSDRLSAKRIGIVIKIFGELKAIGLNVCLLIANQWASGRVRSECLEPHEELAKSVGLEIDKDFAFTSDLHEDWSNGIPKHMVRELFQCSNLFVFPTKEESFGLVVPEAALAGGILPVLNKSLDSQIWISSNQALYIDFGSFSRVFKMENETQYLRDIANIILGRMQQNESIKLKTFFKNKNNMDYLYKTYYLPIMAESKLWVD